MQKKSNRSIIALAVAGATSMLSAGISNAAAIAGWSFDAAGTIAAPYNTAPATTGTGTGIIIGMDNTYNSLVSAASGDVTPTAGASTGAASSAWRIRGTTNGWSSQAPIGTQGAEFDASTTGYQNISVSFDIYMTTQAPAKLELQYTTDGSTWVNASTLTYSTNSAYILTNSSSANTVTGTYFYQTGGQAFYNGLSADLSGVAAANGDASFGIRIVNAATGADDTSYLGAAYNNSSGNWRLDNVVISGTAVTTPEPASLSFVGLGAMALMSRRRKIAR